MTSFQGQGRLLGANALTLCDSVEVNVADIDSAAGRRAFRGWMQTDPTTAAALRWLEELVLELPGGRRLPVTAGAVDASGRVAVIGAGSLTSGAA